MLIWMLLRCAVGAHLDVVSHQILLIQFGLRRTRHQPIRILARQLILVGPRISSKDWVSSWTTISLTRWWSKRQLRFANRIIKLVLNDLIRLRNLLQVCRSFLLFVHDHLLACFGFLDCLIIQRYDDFVAINTPFIFRSFLFKGSHTSNKIFLGQKTCLDQKWVAILLAKIVESGREQFVEI